MAVAIVDELEVVQIDNRTRQAPTGALRATDLLVQSPAHRTMVETTGDRVGAGLRARTHEREYRRGLVDERARLLDRALVVGLGLAPHQHHDRLDLAGERERHEQGTTECPGRGRRGER